MKRAKGFSVFCLFVCMLLGFPVTGSGTTQSNYIVGDIHSNSNYTVALESGHTNLNIIGTVSAVGTATLGPDVTATSTQSGAAPINIPEIDFAGLQAKNGETIGTTEIMYIDGDVSIDLTNIATYQNKTIVATGNIIVARAIGGHQDMDLHANLIARGSIDINLHDCGSTSKSIIGFIYARGEGPVNINHHSKGNFTGVNIDLNGGGCAAKSIQGMIMAKNGSFQMDVHAHGGGDSGIIGDTSVANDLLEFFEYLIYWREIRG